MAKLTPYMTGKYMLLDSYTRRNLELCETLREKQKRGSLLWVLDKTKTAMGARNLRKYIEQPLIDIESINHRLDAVEEFKNQAILREEIREYLTPVYDLERLVSKVTYQTANPRDLIAFESSLSMLPHIKCILSDMSCTLNKKLYKDLDPLEDLCELVQKAIKDEPPIAMKEGTLSGMAIMKKWISSARQSLTAKNGLQNWKRENGKRQELKICGSNTIKCSAIIWK